MGVAVKICGLTTEEAVDAAVCGGAAMTGFVFFPPSPRSLAPEQAAPLVARVPEGVLKVGVVVDPGDAMLESLLRAVALDVLQLHGRETPERAAEIKLRTGRKVMKAIGVGSRADLAAATDYAGVVDYLLFDAKPPRDAAYQGGHGRAFDWRILTGLRVSQPWLLAGGIGHHNLEDAVRQGGASQIDVSSGVEVRPGLKDVAKIEALLERAARLEPARPDQPLGVTA